MSDPPENFPAKPRSWMRTDHDLAGRDDPRTSDLVFICVIVLSAGLLLLGSCYLGLGEGSACTDVPGNGGLDRAPCNRVTHGLMLNVISQATFFVIAWLAGGRRRSHQWMAWTLLACSLGTFIASLAIARSY